MQRLYLPADLMQKHSLSADSVLRGEFTPALGEVAYEVASVAAVHLQKARALRSQLPVNAIPVMLPALISDKFLKKLQKAQWNVMDPETRHLNQVPLQITLLWNWLVKTY